MEREKNGGGVHMVTNAYEASAFYCTAHNFYFHIHIKCIPYIKEINTSSKILVIFIYEKNIIRQIAPTNTNVSHARESRNQVTSCFFIFFSSLTNIIKSECVCVIQKCEHMYSIPYKENRVDVCHGNYFFWV